MITLPPRLRLAEWVVRRSGARLRTALTLVVAINLVYAVAWAIAATLAWLIVRGPRSDMMSLVVTVPMMLVTVPWIWSWPTLWWSETPEMRECVATSMLLGMDRRPAWILCLAGVVSNGLGIATVALALLAAWLL